MSESTPKIIRIFCVLFIFSISSVYGDKQAYETDQVDTHIPEKNSPSHSQTAETGTSNQISEEQILDEIERISKQLDKMEQSGQLSAPIKFAISGVLGTIAYGVAHAQIALLFQPDFYLFPGIAVVSGPSWINAILRGVMDIAIPSLAVGTLIGLANHFPEDLPPLSTDELIAPGLTAIISALTMTTLGAYLLPSSPHFALSMFRTAFITVPINTLALMTAIYIKRTDLHNKKQFDLKMRLQEARSTLEQKKEIKPAPETLSQA